jgi:branched-chain amino acid transport system ATP-binding protein
MIDNPLYNNILIINNISKSFGGLKVLDQVSLKLERSRIFAIIGPNGAGKTTLFNLITNIVPKDKTLQPEISAASRYGVFFHKNAPIDITYKKTYEIAQLGIGRTFQNNRVFSNMSVLENVLIGKRIPSMETPISMIGPWRIQETGPKGAIKLGRLKVEKMLTEKAESLLELVGLTDLKTKKAEEISYGQQKLLSIARVLMSDALLLLLDEPTAGVSQIYAERIWELFDRLSSRDGKTILFIEHDLKFIRKLGCKCLYMERGHCNGIFSDLAEILDNKSIRMKFMGMG